MTELGFETSSSDLYFSIFFLIHHNSHKYIIAALLCLGVCIYVYVHVRIEDILQERDSGVKRFRNNLLN